MEKYPHNLNTEQIFKEFETSINGISQKEASLRLEKYGKNELKGKKKRGRLSIFFSQFKDLMIIILIVAAIVTALITLINKEYSDLIDVGIIVAIVLLNAVIGYIQENKAENALDSLKQLSQPFAKAYRNGKVVSIPVKEIVIGDVIYFESGDVSCADCYIIESNSLKCDESSLTGESTDIEKTANIVLPIGTSVNDRANIIHSGSVVTYGRGLGVVVATGMSTELGKIAFMLENSKEELTPIQQKLNKLSRFITVAVLVVALALFVINIFAGGQNVLNSLMIAIALAVAAIPESLPAVITIIMAIGVSKMSKQNAIVKKMQAVETLGCCKIICSDKTGTLTQNKMTVSEIYTHKTLFVKENLNQVQNEHLFNCMQLCNDSLVQGAELVGDPTETALIRASHKLGHEYNKTIEKYPRISELPFDSIRKMMTSYNKVDDRVIAYTKGAPDIILDHCKYIQTEGDDKITLTKEIKQQVTDVLVSMSKKGLRTLGFAYREHNSNKYDLKDENDLIFLGIVAMRDPPRETSASAVKTCIEAGIRPIMITGDHAITAQAIATEVGIYSEGDIVMTGQELDEIGEEDFRKLLPKITVYARVSPQNKVRIVEAWRATGEVVAMTGDGVNDAPSLKVANIGIGMGKSGTEVTREVADIVLMDDNFATIVGAVSEGRKIYQNIKKVIQFLFGTNLVEVMCIIIVTLIYPHLGFLTALQILFVNMLTDSLPALSLSVEKQEKDIMKRPPRSAKEGLFSGMWQMMTLQVIAQSLTVILTFVVTLNLTGDNLLATTLAFAVLSTGQIFYLVAIRDSHSLFTVNPFHNYVFWLSLVLCFGLNLIVLCIPAVASVFSLTALNFVQILLVLGISITIIPIVEAYKLIMYLVKKYKNKQILGENDKNIK